MDKPTHTIRFDWTYVCNLALEHKRELLKAHVTAVLVALINLPAPLLLPMLVDEVILGKPGRLIRVIDISTPPMWHRPATYVAVVVAAMLVLRAGDLGLSVLQERQFSRISKEIIFHMREVLLKRLEKMDMVGYETLGSGAIATRCVADLDLIDRFVGATIGRFTVATLTLVGIAIILLSIEWKLGLLILLVNPIVIGCTVMLGRHVRELKRREQEAIEAFQENLTNTLEAIQQIRAMGRESTYVQRLIVHARAIRDRSTAFAWRSNAASRLSYQVFRFGFDVFRAVAILMVVLSDLSLGLMVAIFSYLWQMMGPVQELLEMRFSFFAATAALDRVTRLAQVAEERHSSGTMDPFAGRTTVGLRLDDVTLGYGEGPPVLRGVTLGVDAGEKVALVGASGGGKSTLLQALLGFYPLSSGTIYFGGIPLTEIGSDRVRANVGAVLQSPSILNDTIRANLAFGRERPDEELWWALDIAQLDDTVATLEHGLDTVLGNRGVRFSGGQRQRLAIARMLLTDPKIIILDEATSAVDMLTEQRLYAALLTAFADRTMIIIAHRLSALRFADRVFVFEAGSIAQQGRHRELLQRQGLYSKLYTERPHEASRFRAE